LYIEQISDIVSHLKRKYKEDDPYSLAKAMGIKIIYEPMGTYEGACKGFYLFQSRVQIITINSDLPSFIQMFILIHELGHSVLHRKSCGVKAFHEFTLFDETSKMEYEANIFLAEFLMKDDDVLELLNEDMSFFNAAKELCVPPELLDFKFRVLKRKGYKVIDPPTNAKANFLKNDLGGDTCEYEPC